MTRQHQAGAGETAVWGPAATLGWTFVIGIAYIGAQLFGIALYIGYAHPAAAAEERGRLFELYQYHGIALSIGLLVAACVGIALVAVAVRLKRHANPVDYLGLKPFSAAALGYWFLLLFAFIGAFDLLLWLLERPLVPGFSRQIYRSAEGSWLLWLAIVLVAPVTEEVLFRGFLFAGLARSFVGPGGAIALTSALWAVIHLQYDAPLIGAIFVIGLIMGLARFRSGSILLTCVLHSLVNLGAMILTALTVSG